MKNINNGDMWQPDLFRDGIQTSQSEKVIHTAQAAITNIHPTKSKKDTETTQEDQTMKKILQKLQIKNQKNKERSDYDTITLNQEHYYCRFIDKGEISYNKEQAKIIQVTIMNNAHGSISFITLVKPNSLIKENDEYYGKEYFIQGKIFSVYELKNDAQDNTEFSNNPSITSLNDLQKFFLSDERLNKKIEKAILYFA